MALSSFFSFASTIPYLQHRQYRRYGGRSKNTQVFKPPLAPDRLAILSLSFCEPGAEKSAHGKKLLVDDRPDILRSHDHFRLFIFALLASHELGIEGEEQALLADPGQGYRRGLDAGLGLAFPARRAGCIVFRRSADAGQDCVRKEDGGASVEFAAVEEGLGEEVSVEFLKLQLSFFRVWVRREGCRDVICVVLSLCRG